MKILLIGGSGLLGKKLLETAPKEHNICATYHVTPIKHDTTVQLDITDARAVEHVVKTYQPALIIHTASMVYVDECEKQPRHAHQINVLGTQHIVAAAEKTGARLYFFSTNGIYDGTNAPYAEATPAHPHHVYGKTKLAAENYVLKYYAEQSVVFRLNTMYGWHHRGARENPATWMLNRLKTGQISHMVTDIYNSHLWVGQAASCIWQAVAKNILSDIFNIGGGDCINRYEFSKAVAESFGYNTQLIQPVTSDYFPNIAPRPKNTCFDTTKMEQILGVSPIGVLQGLHKMREEL